ncbi:OLC1v1012236C1 [Oldenlandia corymbosa var. corymbosa]|uniref:OLC1v1012236C1 n=1 Tax=Oldenlandia corymbosa var. corymbosa TaxID=529605 RepID=A0AAV1DVJ2_OLDCO|nr:OLC1v1012236C1 [Oldenlandia corymbosa var. corymbosa]
MSLSNNIVPKFWLKKIGGEADRAQECVTTTPQSPPQEATATTTASGATPS